ncbi:histone [Candidatus Bathyarchaeota archaeon ex4484_205]|nr:MAG: histone [Candidatus Bathyarchaeota archaeon ex4484_205]RLG69404.1 MAG: histone [archaeon]
MSEEISSSAIHRIIKKSGAERVGEDAVEELGMVLEEIGIKIGREAVDLAAHAGRKTVKAVDIRKATKSVLRLG